MHQFEIVSSPKHPITSAFLQSTVSRHEATPVINITLIHYLISFKDQIDGVSSMWDKFKRYTNSYEFIHTIHPVIRCAICNYVPLSRSFYKMVEIIDHFNLLKQIGTTPLKSFSFAEGPGGFIEAIAYRRQNALDTYYGMTLATCESNSIPGWRKAKDFREKNKQFRIYNAATGTGDMLEPSNLLHCFKKHSASCKFVTADGGFDFTSDFSNQEAMSLALAFSQLSYALVTQKTGGTFVLKLFDTTTAPSLDILFILWSAYETVHIFKPDTSRPANSERYVICKGFIADIDYTTARSLANTLAKLRQGWKPSRFISAQIPLSFKTSVQESNAIFGQIQIESIASTINLIHNGISDRLDGILRTNTHRCVRWCGRHNLPVNQSVGKYYNKNKHTA